MVLRACPERQEVEDGPIAPDGEYGERERYIGEDNELSWGYIEFEVSEEHTAASFTDRQRARGRGLGWVWGVLDVWEPLEIGGSPKHGVDKLI